MSMWKVSNQQTQERMGEFYSRLLAGMRRADALREAQLILKAKYPAPFHWGAFISQGDPGALPVVDQSCGATVPGRLVWGIWPCLCFAL